ncbi:MAG: phospho-sugar mutase, partial [Myxococcota bacterium]|nr:phospho-sugar mutase [Myxococcota bacterium]
MIERGQYARIVDAFHQVLPFGTGGRRGPVGVGPNRFNPWTLGASVQGHVDFLRQTIDRKDRTVVIAYDVRTFHDLRGQLVPSVADPLRGLSSRAFAEIAAEVYAAAGIRIFMPPVGTYMSTPELSFAIRYLSADGGLNISASHNHPDDNGGKFYNASGSQEVPPRDQRLAEAVSRVVQVERMSLDRARSTGIVLDLPEEVHEAYIQTNLACSRRRETNEERSALKVVFTGLHGTGRNTVAVVLSR